MAAEPGLRGHVAWPAAGVSWDFQHQSVPQQTCVGAEGLSPRHLVSL